MTITVEFIGVLFVAFVFALWAGIIIAIPVIGIFTLLENLTLKLFSDKFEEPIDFIYCALLVIVLVVFVLWHTVYTAIPTYMINQTPWEEINYATHQLVNLADNNEINGSITGSRSYVRGYIGETTTYHYYYKTADGGMKLQKVGSATATIYPTDEIEPCAKWYRMSRSFWWKNEESYYCKIYVPEGTVSTEFVIDMQ